MDASDSDSVDRPADPPTDEQVSASAAALGRKRWAGTTAEERSAAMRALALARAAKLTEARRAEIAAQGGRANTGPRKPGAGRPRKKRPENQADSQESS